ASAMAPLKNRIRLMVILLDHEASRGALRRRKGPYGIRTSRNGPPVRGGELDRQLSTREGAVVRTARRLPPRRSPSVRRRCRLDPSGLTEPRALQGSARRGTDSVTSPIAANPTTTISPTAWIATTFPRPPLPQTSGARAPPAAE